MTISQFERQPLIFVITQATIDQVAELVKTQYKTKLNPKELSLLTKFKESKKIVDELAEHSPDLFEELCRMMDAIDAEENVIMAPIISDPTLLICWQVVLFVRGVENKIARDHSEPSK